MRLSASSRESAASNRAELGPTIRPRQREAQRSQVSADGLELADDRLPLLRRQLLRRRSAQLREPLERGPGVVVERSRLRRDDEARVFASLHEAPRPAERRHHLNGRVRGGGELLVRHGGDRVDREPPQPREIELDVVLGKVELVEVGTHRLWRKALLAQLLDRGVPVALRELLPVRAEHEAVVDHLGQLASQRPGDALLHREVRPVVGAADDVRDPEVEVVGHRGELVRRRPVRAKQCRSVRAQPHGAVLVAPGGA